MTFYVKEHNRQTHLMKRNKNEPTKLIGLGLDSQDGHKRMTKSERFMILGGSEETHETITETVIKTFETLDKKGKTLDTVENQELGDIIQSSVPQK